MDTFLSDAWFRIFSVGFLLSAASFPLLLRKYRDAQAPADPEASGLNLPGASFWEESDRPQPVRAAIQPKSTLVAPLPTPKVEPRVFPAAVPETPRTPAPASSSPAAERTPLSAVAPSGSTLEPGVAAKPAVAAVSKATTTGGISPAVVYLQNLKLQMEHFEKEINQLRGQVSAFAQKHDKQFDALLTRISELQGELHEQVHTTVQSPMAEEASVVERPSTEADATLLAEEAPKATAVKAEDSIQEPAELKLEPPPSAQEDILKPKGKGPVWPV